MLSKIENLRERLILLLELPDIHSTLSQEDIYLGSESESDICRLITNEDLNEEQKISIFDLNLVKEPKNLIFLAKKSKIQSIMNSVLNSGISFSQDDFISLYGESVKNSFQDEIQILLNNLNPKSIEKLLNKKEVPITVSLLPRLSLRHASILINTLRQKGINPSDKLIVLDRLKEIYDKQIETKKLGIWTKSQKENINGVLQITHNEEFIKSS
jgi:hypothetical protein